MNGKLIHLIAAFTILLLLNFGRPSECIAQWRFGPIKSSHSNPLSTLKHKGKEAVEKVGNKWNKVREEVFDEIGDDISEEFKGAVDKFKSAAEKLEYTLKTIVVILKNSGEFPNAIANARIILENPDISIEIERSYIESLVNEIIKQPIQFDDKPSNNYLQLRNGIVSFDTARNVIICKFSDGVAGFDEFIRGGLRVKGATVELAPRVAIGKNKVIINMFARVRYIDVENSGEETDKIFAAAIEELKFSEGPLLSRDITDDVTIQKELTILGAKRLLSLTPSEASVFVESDRLVIQANLKGSDKQ